MSDEDEQETAPLKLKAKPSVTSVDADGWFRCHIPRDLAVDIHRVRDRTGAELGALWDWGREQFSNDVMDNLDPHEFESAKEMQTQWVIEILRRVVEAAENDPPTGSPLSDGAPSEYQIDTELE